MKKKVSEIAKKLSEIEKKIVKNRSEKVLSYKSFFSEFEKNNCEILKGKSIEL